MINWYYYPKIDKIPEHLMEIFEVFKNHKNDIKSPEKTLSSNKVLSIIAEDLEALDFQVEKSKEKENKIEMPVLFGKNGKIEKRFFIDGYNKNTHTILEVEAGTAISNNSFLMDLIKSCLIKEAQYFVIAVRNRYRGSTNFKKVATFYNAIYTTDRLKLPLKGILLIGY